MNSEAVRAILQQDVAALTALKVQRTPTFYVNGKPLTDFGAAQLKQLVAEQTKIAYGS
jgi:protein-disulfide isomerase